MNKTIIKINHIGFYTCSAYHSLFGIFNKTIRIALKSPPEIIHDKNIYSVYLGQTVTLLCSISLDIPIQVKFCF